MTRAASTPLFAPIVHRGGVANLFILAACAGLAGASLMQAQAASSAAQQSGSLTAEAARTAGPKIAFAQAALTFEPNLGQDPSRARFIAYGHGYELRLEPDEASVVFSGHPDRAAGKHAADPTIGLQLVAPNQDAAMLPEEKAQGEHSYFPSGDPSSWITHVPQYGRVTYQGVYPGVDLSFYGNAGRLEYDFILQPNADASRLQLDERNAVDCLVDAHGDLHLSSGGAAIRLLKPLAYQLSPDGLQRVPVEVRYRIRRAGEGIGPYRIGFSIGAYDHHRKLVIDPVMLYGLDIPGASGYSYPPYYFADTNILAMTADAAGNTYVAASVGNSYASTSILKYDPNGNLLLNASMGSPSSYIYPRAIAVDASGDVYLTGTASVGLPTTANALEPVIPSSGGAAFLAVVKADGSALTYSSYLGQSNEDTANGLAVDATGAAYVTGYTDSPEFPTTAGAYQTAWPNQGQYAGFVTKLNPALAGNAGLVYSTLLSGEGLSQGEDIAIDGAGDAFVISSAAPGFPVTPGAYNFDGPSDSGAYLTKLNPQGTDLVFSAYLGPAFPAGVVVDGSGSAYVTGTVTSSNFPVTSGAYQTSYPGGFVLKMNSTGTGLLYSTWLSGPSGYAMNNVQPVRVAIAPGCASSCAVYVAGTTTTADFPLVNPIQSFPAGYGLEPATQQASVASNGFLVELTGTGKAAAFSTYLGGASSATNGTAIAVDGHGNMFFAANVAGADAPVTLPAVQFPGYGYLAKISPSSAGVAVAVPTHVVFANSQPVNATTSTGGTVELRNMGSAAITLTRPFAVSSPEFAETDNCPASLPGGDLCTLSVSFTPAASGQRSGILSIASSGLKSPTLVDISGTAVDAPDLQLSTTYLLFADQVVTTASAAQVVTLTNAGDEPQPITSILPGGIADFKATSNCPAQLAAGAKCQVSVVFSPSQIGLLADYLYIEFPAGYDYVDLEGSGVAGPTGTGTVQFSPTSLSFGSIVLGQSGTSQELFLMNTGDAPVTVNALTITPTAGQGNSGDFSLIVPSYGYSPLCRSGYAVGSNQPYATPFEIEPQGSCAIYVTFQPSIAGQEAATLSMSDSAVGSPHTLGLSGIGLSSQQPLAISPSTATFPAQPVHDPSAAQTFTITNPGEDSVAIDRIFTTGDFGIASGGNCSGSSLGPQTTCSVSVLFDPAASGTRTGTLTLTDSISGTPSVFNLSGTGIAATGALVLGQSSLTFGTQDAGSTSQSLELLVSNPGNSPVTINSIESTPQFAATSQPGYYNSPSFCGGILSAGSTCAIEVVFSPTQAGGAVSGSLIIHSTAGTIRAGLSGTATASAEAIHITPTTINFGGSLIGGTTTNHNDAVTVYIDNTGGAPVTFSTAPSITGVAPAPAADFQFRDSTCYQYLPLYANSTPPPPMPPGASCSFTLTFVPSLPATEKATFVLTDSAGKQTIALSGLGMTSSPPISLDPPVLTFDRQAAGASTPVNYQNEIGPFNTGSQPVTISSVAVSAGSADFSLASGDGYCAGYTLNPGQGCDAVFQFHPSAIGYRTGTATFTDSAGNQYTAALAGYGVTPLDAAQVTPQVLVLPDAPVRPAPGATPQGEITLNNTGNTPLTIGTITGTNVASGDDFPAVTSYCSGVTVQAGSSCSVGVSFQPLATGQRTGSLTFPVTYSDQTTATLTANLSGLGQAPVHSATLTPSSATFPSVVAGTSQFNYQNSISFVLTNTGNVQVAVGTVTGTDLTTTAGTGGDFYESNTCYYDNLAPQSECVVTITFSPLTTGLKSGSISVPVTYSGGGAATVTATFTGQGVAQAPAAQVTPAGLAFNPEVTGTTDSTNAQAVTVASTGNVNLVIKSITTSPNFTVANNTCYSPMENGWSCSVSVGFTPLATTAAGNVTGTLTIVDNAPNSPQVVRLSGKAISASQELALSQATVTFASQKAGTVSAGQVVYLTDLGAGSNSGSPSRIQINSIVLAGANASDFSETQMCGGNLGFTIEGRTDCEITVAFAPGANSFEARTATVTITPAKGPALVITLKGNAYGPPAALAAPKPGSVLAGPDVAFSWAPETGATGYALHLGSVAGASDLYSSGTITAASAEPTTLPTTGQAIYATLITYYGTVAVTNSCKFTEATASSLIQPTAGGTLASPTQFFAWTSGVGATSWSLQLGSEGPGSSDLYTSGNRTSTSVTVPGLPATGTTIDARLTTGFHGASVFRDYTFAAAPPRLRTAPVKLPVSPATK
ncbi:MAG TPA: choice-of-anchor D domain-containing protein [Acidobacteriaceae bacterium]